ncbi:MAG: hypothetical protein WKF84_21905 [Pyrinomonadaceae bacterium]
MPLVGLPGRAGMDVAIGLYYNSLVWTRDSTGIKFDVDRGQPSAGFRVGFPTMQGPYTSKSGAEAYVLITPEGVVLSCATISRWAMATKSTTRLTTNSQR